MERKVTLNQPACTPGAALSMLANPLDLGPPCRPGRPKPALSLTLSCDTAAAAAELHLQLQQAAAQRSAAGLPTPRDLGAAIPLPAGGTAMHSTSVQERPGRAGVAAAARADLLLSQQEDEEAGQCGSPACSTHEAHAAAIVAATEDPRCATAAGVAAGDARGKHMAHPVAGRLIVLQPPAFCVAAPSSTHPVHTPYCSLEDLELLAEFAELARSASGGGTSGPSSSEAAPGTCEAAPGSCPTTAVKQEAAAAANAAAAAAGAAPVLCGVRPPDSPAVLNDAAAAGCRSSMDGGSSISQADEPLQRQSSEVRSTEVAPQAALLGQADVAVQRGQPAPIMPAQLQQAMQQPGEGEGPALKKQRCEPGSPASSSQQAQRVQQTQQQQQQQPAKLQAWAPAQLVQRAAGQPATLPAMPMLALPPALLQHMAALQQAAAAASAAGAAASSATASPATGNSPTAAGAAAPAALPRFAMPPAAGMIPVMLPPAVAAAMQRQLAAAQQAAGSGLPHAVPVVMPATAGSLPPAAAALPQRTSAQPHK